MGNPIPTATLYECGRGRRPTAIVEPFGGLDPDSQKIAETARLITRAGWLKDGKILD